MNSPSSRLRVLHVVETWRPIATGYTSRGWQIVAAQAASDACAPHVLVSSRQGHTLADKPNATQPDTKRVAPSPVIEQRLRRIRPYHTATRALAAQIVAACRDWRIDIIHCHWPSAIGAAARRGPRPRAPARRWSAKSGSIWPVR